MITLKDMPLYVSNYNSASLENAKRNAKLASEIRFKLSGKLEDLKKKVEIELNPDEESRKRTTALFLKLNKDIVETSQLFLSSKDAIWKISFLDEFLQKYLDCFNDLNNLRQLINNYTAHKYHNQGSLYLIERVTEPYYNAMIQFIDFANQLTGIFSMGKEDADIFASLGEMNYEPILETTNTEKHPSTNPPKADAVQ